MKISRAILGLFLALSVASCGTIRRVPVETQTIYNYIDSIRYEVRDSIVLIPIEVIRNYVPVYDTLVMETSLAKSVSYVDTTNHCLKGNLENKKEIVYKDRIVYEDRIEYRDSLVYKEIPIEVVKDKIVKPRLYWYSIILNIIFILLIFFFIYIKIKS